MFLVLGLHFPSLALHLPTRTLGLAFLERLADSPSPSLPQYAYNLRNSVEGELKAKLETSDKEALDKAITETISWLDASAEASTEEYAGESSFL